MFQTVGARFRSNESRSGQQQADGAAFCVEWGCVTLCGAASRKHIEFRGRIPGTNSGDSLYISKGGQSAAFAVSMQNKFELAYYI